MVREDDWLELNADLAAVVTREHVHFALVDAELANVRAQEEDVGALHEWVQDLRTGQLVLGACHDHTALLDAVEVEAARDVEHLGPVARRLRADLVRAPEELDALHVHARRLPHLDQVLADGLDLMQVAAHLVVHEREPVGDPEDERAADRRQLVHVDGLVQPLCDVHPTARLEAVVAREIWLLQQEILQVVDGLALLADAQHHLELTRELGRGSRVVGRLGRCGRCCRGRRRRRTLRRGAIRALGSRRGCLGTASLPGRRRRGLGLRGGRRHGRGRTRHLGCGAAHVREQRVHLSEGRHSGCVPHVTPPKSETGRF